MPIYSKEYCCILYDRMRFDGVLVSYKVYVEL